MTTTTVAEQCLQGLVDELARNKKDGKTVTLAYWRLLKNTSFLAALRQFAAGPDWDEQHDRQTQHQAEVQTLFNALNDAMWEQELTVWPGLLGCKPGSNDLPVVFGGKYAARANSISEKLVQLLAASSSKVYTVSRSSLSSVPQNIVHISKQNLDKAGAGVSEFQDVLEVALEEWKSVCPEKTLVPYFTLGQHTGVNPFMKNIASASNLALALEQIKPRLLNKSFRLVVTGTDATKPGTHPDPSVEIDGETYTVPSYKIVSYNFVYAMSKLCQFYILANAVLQIKDQTPEGTALSKELTDTIQKLKSNVEAAGQNGTYNPSSGGITMEELDDIAAGCVRVESAVKPHLTVAKDISICYTPLHAKPWTEQAFVKCKQESKGSPRAYLIQQVVRRTKNAISIEKAARSHFVS